MYGNVSKVQTCQFCWIFALFELVPCDLRQIRAFGQQYGHCVFNLAWCTLSLKIWEKQLGNMVIVFYIKHGVQRDQPPVKIGKTPQQFTCAYLETYTQFDFWTELQRKKGSLASNRIERVRTEIGAEYLPQPQN